MACENKELQLFIDSDVGVDDSLAIIWLAMQKNIKILGITTVAGNSSVQDATHNVLTLLEVINRQDITVTMGAARPLVFSPLAFGKLIMGPDGLWGRQKKYNLEDLSTDAPAAIAEAAKKNPDMIVLGLGPATNLAQAVERFPDIMAKVNIILMVNLPNQKMRGAIQGAGFNAYADPHAIDILLNYSNSLTILGPGTIDQITVDNVEYIEKIAKNTDPINQFIFSILKPCFDAESLGQRKQLIIYDFVLAIIAAKPELIKKTVSGFGRISVHNDFTAGEISVKTDPQGKIFLSHSHQYLSELTDLAFSDPKFNLLQTMEQLLQKISDNIQVILDVDINSIKEIIEEGFNTKEA